MNRAKVRASFFAALATLTALSGCGQTGPLTLPGTTPAAGEAPAPQTEEEENQDEER